MLDHSSLRPCVLRQIVAQPGFAYSIPSWVSRDWDHKLPFEVVGRREGQRERPGGYFFPVWRLQGWGHRVNFSPEKFIQLNGFLNQLRSHYFLRWFVPMTYILPVIFVYLITFHLLTAVNILTASNYLSHLCTTEDMDIKQAESVHLFWESPLSEILEVLFKLWFSPPSMSSDSWNPGSRTLSLVQLLMKQMCGDQLVKGNI